MGTTAQKLQAIANSKAAIKAAIEAKGVSGVGNRLSDYAGKIAAIPSGGGGDIMFVIGQATSRPTDGGLYLEVDGVSATYPNIYTNPTTVRFESEYWGNKSGFTHLTIQYADGTSQNIVSDTTINVTQSMYVIVWSNETCLAGDTLITLADGTTRRIDQLKVGDKVLSINPATNAREEDEITFSDADSEKYGEKVDAWTLSDGTVLKTINPHEFYNSTIGKFQYIADIPFGSSLYKIDETTPRLVKHEVIEERTRHFTIFTKKWNNYFANGILSGNRTSTPISQRGDRNGRE